MFVNLKLTNMMEKFDLVLLLMRKRAPETRGDDSARRSLGLRLRQARQAAGITLQAVGDIIGVVRESVSQWEIGRNYPTPDRLLKLGEIYGVSVDWLLSGGRQVAESRAVYDLGEIEEFVMSSVAIVGVISAGGLVEAWQEDLGTLEVPSTIIREAPRAFGLRVSGSSLAAEWIYEGAIVVVDPDAKFIDGKIYAVSVDSAEIAARRVYDSGPLLKLVTGDGRVDEFPKDRVSIIGRIRWSFREH